MPKRTRALTLAKMSDSQLAHVMRGHVVALLDIVSELRTEPTVSSQCDLSAQLDRLESALAELAKRTEVCDGQA